MRIEFESEVIRWDAREDSSWYFITLPEELSSDIKELPRPPRGFGSLRVRARIGLTSWMTSIFPGSDGYVLPLKKSVRDAEGLGLGKVGIVVARLGRGRGRVRLRHACLTEQAPRPMVRMCGRR